MFFLFCSGQKSIRIPHEKKNVFLTFKSFNGPKILLINNFFFPENEQKRLGLGALLFAWIFFLAFCVCEVNGVQIAKEN